MWLLSRGSRLSPFISSRQIFYHISCQKKDGSWRAFSHVVRSLSAKAKSANNWQTLNVQIAASQWHQYHCWGEGAPLLNEQHWCSAWYFFVARCKKSLGYCYKGGSQKVAFKQKLALLLVIPSLHETTALSLATFGPIEPPNPSAECPRCIQRRYWPPGWMCWLAARSWGRQHHLRRPHFLRRW